MLSLQLGQHKIKYLEAGSGPPMAMFHNGGSGHWVWHYQIQHFSKSNRVLAFDMLGCGGSDRPDRPYDLNFYAEMIKNIFDVMQLRDVILLGNCVGAAAALEYAIRDSSKLRALILFNLCGGPDMMVPLVRRTSSPWPVKLQPLQELGLKLFAWTPGVLKAAVQMNYSKAPDESDPVFLAECKEAGNPLQTKSRMNLIRGLSSFNKFSHEFHRPAHLPPTAVFWGKDNRVLPARAGLILCDRLRPERKNIVDGAGHFLMAEKCEYVNSEIESFCLQFDDKISQRPAPQASHVQPLI